MIAEQSPSNINDPDYTDKRGKMHYTQLLDAVVDTDDQVSFYGIIIDAGHPYKGQNRYICTVKVIDQSMHSIVESDTGKIKFGLITFFAKRLEDLPVVRKIGDIIRVHRSLVKEYKGLKQFSVNIQYNSSWCLFYSSDIILRDIKNKGVSADQDAELEHLSSSESEDQEMETEMPDGTTKADRASEKSERRKYTPYKFSGKSYSFDLQQERLIVDTLRGFMDSYFMKNSWIFKKGSKQLGKLKEMSDNREVDLLVKILKIFEKDENELELRIKDTSNEMWFITIPKIKFGNLREGEIVRIRSVEVNMTSNRNVISCK
jgi:hypothetical protein